MAIKKEIGKNKQLSVDVNKIAQFASRQGASQSNNLTVSQSNSETVKQSDSETGKKKKLHYKTIRNVEQETLTKWSYLKKKYFESNNDADMLDMLIEHYIRTEISDDDKQKMKIFIELS